MPKGKFYGFVKLRFSDDYFFIVGISTLLTSELIDENYYIVDVETTNLLRLKSIFCRQEDYCVYKQ